MAELIIAILFLVLYKDKSSDIISQLVKHSFEVNKDQTDAWDNQISELQSRLEKCQMTGDIIFEYDIVSLGKRIDVILLIKHMVFSLEFKNGKNIFTASDAQQSEDSKRMEELRDSLKSIQDQLKPKSIFEFF
ncbi:MAG: hypothetical protein HUJ68_09245 [Clostridia bacterium]|nr:hypothetical protein [Clostridia bacterium]